MLFNDDVYHRVVFELRVNAEKQLRPSCFNLHFQSYGVADSGNNIDIQSTSHQVAKSGWQAVGVQIGRRGAECNLGATKCAAAVRRGTRFCFCTIDQLHC